MLCILAGAAAALMVMPYAVRWSRDDTSRLCTILEACRSRNPPRVVVFGDSTGMFGVDARQLGGWNFCSPAQTLGESLLLQQELPAGVTTVVQLVTHSQLAGNVAIEPDHYNAMLLCGYAPRAETRAAMVRVFGPDIARKMDVHPLAARLHAHRHVRAAIEGLARDLLRRDSSRARLTRDLYFPIPTGPGGGLLPERRFAALAKERYVVRDAEVQLLREAARSREHYLVVLAPIHPRLNRGTLHCPAGVDCVDLTTLLSEREFQDPTHATRDGAMRVTKSIRDALAARGLLLRQ